MASETPPLKRLFVGGLFPNVTEEALRERFSRFGVVCGVEIKQKKDDEGSAANTFAFINIKGSEQSLTKCFNVLSGTRWQGHEMRVHYAKENFLDRLKQEREANQSSPNAPRVSANAVPLGTPHPIAPKPCTEVPSDSKYEPLALLQNNLRSKPKKRKNDSDSDDEKEKKLPRFGGTSCNPVQNITPTPVSNQKSLLARLDKFSSVWTDNNSEKRIAPPPLPVVDAEKKKITPEAAAKALQSTEEPKVAKKKEKASKNLSNEAQEAKIKPKKVKLDTSSPVKPEKIVKPAASEEEKISTTEQAKLDNEKRIKSLAERKLATQNQQNLIRQALSSVDASKKRNIVRFDSESDEEAEKPTEIVPKLSKPQLFYDNDEDSDPDTELRLKPQFGGEKGQKLLELQARYGNDPRFALSAKFANDAVAEQTEDKADDEMDTNEEKRRQLSILESVVGKEVVKPVQPGKPVVVKNKTFMRYDPSEEGHKTLEKNAGSSEKPEINDNFDPNDPEGEKKPVVSQESYYSVNENLTALFKTQGAPSGGFSLRKALGREDDKEPKSSGFTFFGAQKGVVEPEKEPEFSTEDEQAITAPETVTGSYLKSTGMWREPFFFKTNDNRLMDGVDFVTAVLEVSDDKGEWKRHRDDLVHFYRNKMRRVTAQKAFQSGRGGRGQERASDEKDIQGVAAQQRQTAHRGGRGRGRGRGYGRGRGFGAQHRQRGQQRPSYG